MLLTYIWRRRQRVHEFPEFLAVCAFHAPMTRVVEKGCPAPDLGP